MCLVDPGQELPETLPVPVGQTEKLVRVAGFQEPQFASSDDKRSKHSAYRIGSIKAHSVELNCY